MLEVEGDRGEVALGMIDVPEIDRHDGYCFLNTGSPHYVEFVEDVRSVDVCSRGAAVRWGEPFAAGGGTNVNLVDVEGGTLFVAFESADGSSFSHVVLTGPAKKVFEGEIDLKI